MFSKLRKLIHKFWSVSKASSITIRRTRQRTMKLRKEEDLRNLSGYGYKVFSQSDEDVIIAEIFKRIGFKNKISIEFWGMVWKIYLSSFNRWLVRSLDRRVIQILRANRKWSRKICT